MSEEIVKLLWNDYGMSLVEKNSEYYLHYDLGDHVSTPVTSKINFEQAEKIQSSKAGAIEVLNELQKMKKNSKSTEVQNW